MKLFCTTTLACALSVIGGVAWAQGTPSSKATAAINTVSVSCPSSTTTTGACDTGWVNVMSATIKTSNIADLFVSPSLVTGLFTSTTVKVEACCTTATSAGLAEVQDQGR